MKITDLNASGGIGANSHFVKIGPFNILVDCGLHPKMIGKQALPNYNLLGAVNLDLIIVTHCHLDHLGSLPVIAALHPHAPIITSIPNISLAPRMLRNSINVMKRQREEHGIVDYPLFLHRDISHVNKQLVAQRYSSGEIYYKNGENIEVILHPAGHVVGAAAVELVYKHRRIVFSGDILFDNQLTLAGAKLPKPPIDTLILETTRGAHSRAEGTSRSTEVDRFVLKMNEILARGGSCLIPVFALGRMQEVLKIVYNARSAGKLARCPIVAAGLGMDLCNYFDKIRKKSNLIDFDIRILDHMGVNNLEFNLRPGRDLSNKGIYIVSSGMMVQHTPSYKLAAAMLAHKHNGVCFVGYCDPDTPGGELLGTKNMDYFYFDALDYRAKIQASVDQFDLSGHADRDELANYAIKSSARVIVLNHGEELARQWFQEYLEQELPKANILNLVPGKEYNI
ncbi:MAG: MBL fold metallo-hydrolase [Puniceicoccaceae bacterium MED-G31]|nr:MAG: MBL fold metallo-hydrolase [Puniceicoccaceae bacterium MED-G31]